MHNDLPLFSFQGITNRQPNNLDNNVDLESNQVTNEVERDIRTEEEPLN